MFYLFGIKISFKMNENRVNKLAWWIPVRKWQDNFRNKMLNIIIILNNFYQIFNILFLKLSLHFLTGIHHTNLLIFFSFIFNEILILNK